MAAPKLNNRKDLLLLLCYSPGKTGMINEPVRGRTRIVKMLFLFKEEVLKHFSRGTEIDERNFYQFFPWNFGPFSSEVYDDLSFFMLRGFLAAESTPEEALPEAEAEWQRWSSQTPNEESDQNVTEFQEEEFSLTDKGMAFTEKLYSSLTENQKNLLKEFKAKLNSAPLRAILRYVYKTYPKSTTNSVIKGEILGNYVG